MSKLPKPRILLEKDGDQLTSEQLAELIQKTDYTWTFIIGWPFGVDVALLKPYITHILSRWKQTMPHGLALVVLLEQIRRAKCINEGRTYHYLKKSQSKTLHYSLIYHILILYDF